MTDAQLRHFLTFFKRVLYAGKAVCDIVAQSVVLAGVYPDYEVAVLCRNLHQLLKHSAQVSDIVYFLAYYIAAGNVRIVGNSGDYVNLLLDVLIYCRVVADDRQRNSADCREESDSYSRFPGNCRHYFMHLIKHFCRTLGLYKGCVGYFKVTHSAFFTASGNPQQLVLEQAEI